MNSFPFLVALALASVGAVALGLVVQRLLRDAAARHAVLLASLLLPPVLLAAVVTGLRLPTGQRPVHIAFDTSEAPEAVVAVAYAADSTLPRVLAAVWLAGVLVALARIVIAAWRWRGVAERAEVVTAPAILGRYDGDAILARSSEVSEPTVIGIVDPIVVLPAAYDLEPAELDAVFAHELTHIVRRDNLTALAVQLVCAAFWFDPLHRVARRKLVELRERVCDDAVVERGCDVDAYLTALARSCATSLHNPAVACMSRLNLHERMQSIMTHETRRRWPLPLTRISVAAAVVTIALGFATFVPAPSFAASDAPAGIPDFDVRVTSHPDGRYTLNVRIDTPDGPFSSVTVVKSAPDTRTISTTQGGLTYEVRVKIEADGTVQGALAVKEGERIVGARSKPFAAAGLSAAPDDGVTPPRVIERVPPLFPNDAKEARVAGVAIIRATIDETGAVTGTRILKDLPFGLGQAAADAVRQWKFEPATRDGKPVATEFNVTINFKLDDE